jgi:glycosyltransferase involved in cell wall biosynthesis
VYCQEDGAGSIFEDNWRGVRRIRIPVATRGALGTIVFDWKSTLHAAGEKGLILTLGYNTAIFCVLYRLRGVKNVINMDGIEWRREKWGWVAKVWFWLNDWAGSWLGNHLVADHPEIKRHLATRVTIDKITMIPYGSDRVEEADAGLIEPYDLEPDSYAILIARAEPENSILEVVRAWSRQPRGCKLVVLGKYDPGHSYQQMVKSAASEEVVFLGAIYDQAVVQALRFFSRFYIHGHKVGGTNPSLVEALSAGNAVLAHDNPFNRWVADEGGAYFKNENECAMWIDRLLGDNTASPPVHVPVDGGNLLARMQAASRLRHAADFSWEKVLSEYEDLLSKWGCR